MRQINNEIEKKISEIDKSEIEDFKCFAEEATKGTKWQYKTICEPDNLYCPYDLMASLKNTENGHEYKLIIELKERPIHYEESCMITKRKITNLLFLAEEYNAIPFLIIHEPNYNTIHTFNIAKLDAENAKQLDLMVPNAYYLDDYTQVANRVLFLDWSDAKKHHFEGWSEVTRRRLNIS